MGTCLTWTATKSIHLPIPDSHVPPDAPTATVEEVTAALTVSGWRNTCSFMGIYIIYINLSLYGLLSCSLSSPVTSSLLLQLGSLEGHLVSCQM